MEFDTIAGIASGMGGGIGIIRISGPEALKAAGAIRLILKKKRHTRSIME